MRRFAIAAALVLVLAPAGAARAGPLASASLEVFFSLSALEIDGSGATGFAASATSATIAAGSAFAGQVKVGSPTTAAPPVSGYGLVAGSNAGGSFTGATPGSVGGAVAFSGVAEVYAFGTVLLGVPLELGVPGVTTGGSGLGVNVTAIGASWTVGTATVTGLSGTATAATMMGANGLTPGGAGTLVLVTPVKVITSIAGTLPLFGRLTLQYVPEPTTAALLALGCTGLACRGLGWRRER